MFWEWIYAVLNSALKIENAFQRFTCKLMLTLMPSFCGSQATVWYSEVGAWLVNTNRWGTICPSTTRWSIKSFRIFPLELTKVSKDDWIPWENPRLYLSWSYLLRMKTHILHKYFSHERLCSVHYVILHQLYLPTKLYRGIKCRINWHKEGVGSSNTEHTHTIIHVGRLVPK